MIILLDTGTIGTQLIIVNERTVRILNEVGRTLARNLLKFFEEKRRFASDSGIGVMKGPGSHYGLRIGLTVFCEHF